MDFDIHTKPDEVRLFLCKPNREEIAELKESFDREIILNYGRIGQLTFMLPYVIPSGVDMIDNPHIDYIKGDYLIRYEKGNEQIYFIITNQEKQADQDGKEFKFVECKELQYEWKNKIVRNYAGDKKPIDPLGQGVFQETLEKMTDWKVEFVDSSATTKILNFKEQQKNLLEFVYSTADRYNLIPIVDTVKKTVSFYLDENVGVYEGLSIEKGKYLKTFNEIEKDDEIVTRLYCVGKDGLTFSDISVGGVDFVENLSYYMYGYEEDENGNVISHSPFMSDELVKAIKNHNQLIESKKGEFNSLIQQRESIIESLNPLLDEMNILQSELEDILKQIDKAISKGQDLTSLNQEKAAKESQINAKQSEIDVYDDKLNSVVNQIQALREEISEENNFTPELLREKQRFIKEAVFQDNSIISADELLKAGVERLKRLCQPIIHFQVDAIDFTQALNTKEDWDKLKIGGIVKVSYSKFGTDIFAKIISIQHAIDEKKLTLTIANSKDIKSGFLKIQELLNQSINTATQVANDSFKWDKSVNNELAIDRLLNSSWDATKNKVVAGMNEKVTIDQRGITLVDPDNPNNILRLLSSVIAMSNDGGNTFKTGIDADGLIANNLKGVILAGKNLLIQNESGTFLVDGNGVTVGNMNLNVTRLDEKSRIVISPEDGLKIQSKVNNQWVDKLFADTNGDLTLTGNIRVGSGNSIFTADQNGIALGSSSWSNAPFRVDLAGNAYARTMTLASPSITNGSIVGTSINVGNGNFVVDSDGNVTIRKGTISWGLVPPPTAADVGALASNSPMLTYISPTGIYTGSLNANQITAGTISADRIATNISQVNNVLNVGTTSNSFARIVFGGRSNLEYDASGNFYMTGGKNIYLRADATGGTVRAWNDDEGGYNTVATREWVIEYVRNNSVAKFA